MSIILINPARFDDSRGWFSETYVDKKWFDKGIQCKFVQDNHSYSKFAGTIRGIHFQSPPHAQAKLVRCIRGSIVDYAVDLRNGSPTFGHYVSAELSADNGRQLFIPVGFGHAFITLEPDCEVLYKVTDYYAPKEDGGIRWDCAQVAIDWPLRGNAPELSDKDMSLPDLTNFVSPFEYDGQPIRLISAEN